MLSKDTKSNLLRVSIKHLDLVRVSIDSIEEIIPIATQFNVAHGDHFCASGYKFLVKFSSLIEGAILFWFRSVLSDLIRFC